MPVVRLFVKVLDGREAERELRKLLKRHGDKIVAVAIVVRVDNDQQAGAILRNYRLRPAALPATILLPISEQKERG